MTSVALRHESVADCAMMRDGDVAAINECHELVVKQALSAALGMRACSQPRRNAMLVSIMDGRDARPT